MKNLLTGIACAWVLAFFLYGFTCFLLISQTLIPSTFLLLFFSGRAFVEVLPCRHSFDDALDYYFWGDFFQVAH